MKQKIIFTALPNGINPVTKKLKLSVAISLQVIETEIVMPMPKTKAWGVIKLRNVPDMQLWPNLINSAKFVIQVKDVQLNKSMQVDALKITPDADWALWRNLFPTLANSFTANTINVAAFEQKDLSTIPILSYPVKHIVNHIKSIVNKTGNAFPRKMPDGNFHTSNTQLTDISNYRILEFYKKLPATLEGIVANNANDEKIKTLFGSKPFVNFNQNAAPVLDFAQLSNFHGLYNRWPQQDFQQHKKPDFEFHEIIAGLSQHPKLMRMLGLVIDFEIGQDASPLLKTGAVIQVFPTGLPLTTPTIVVCPGTTCELTGNGFYSKPASGSFYDKGYVKINSENFTVFQLDADGGALKLISHIDALQIKKGKDMAASQTADPAGIAAYNNLQTNRAEGLPSNRSAGIAIAKNGLASHLNTRFVRMNQVKASLPPTGNPLATPPQPPPPPPTTPPFTPPGVNNTLNAVYVSDIVLDADDVTIGYRMDVKMKDKKWCSLHFHENIYSFLNPGHNNVAIAGIDSDEGFIQLSTSQDKRISGPHMKLSEVMARWEGWSLAAPPPGLSLNEPILNKTTAIDKEDDNKFKTTSDAKFRLNVIPVVKPGSLPKLRFGESYDIKLRMVDMAGNSLSHDAEPEKNANTPSKDPQETVVKIIYKRYEPADTPFLLYTKDIKGIKDIKDGESAEVMVIRSNEGTVADYEKNNFLKGQQIAYKDVCVRHVKPPRATVGMAITHGKLDEAIGLGNPEQKMAEVYDKIAKEKDPEVIDPVLKKDADLQYSPSFATADKDIPTIEYLADPMAAGVSFFLSDLDPNNSLSAADFSKRFSFYFDDEVKTDDDANGVNKNVYNENGLKYASWMAPKTFRIILKEGVSKVEMTWTNEPKDANNNPARTLIVSLPKGIMLKLNYACFWRPTDVSELSGVLDMLCQPNDPVRESVAKSPHWLFSPWRTLTLVHAVQRPVASPAGISTFPLPILVIANSDRDQGNTSARVNISFTVHAPSTGLVDVQADWKELVPDKNAEKGVKEVPMTAKVHHFATSYARSSYAFGSLPGLNVNPGEAILHHFNDTRHRWVNYEVIASTRYKEYFFNLIDEKKKNNEPFDITRKSNKAPNVNVLSSARPAAPQIAYVIPTFEWRELKMEPPIRQRDCGLRIYLKGPWYSSGEGEKLAVVLMPLPVDKSLSAGNLELMEKICTTWGNDPTKFTPTEGEIFPFKEAFPPIGKGGDANNLYAQDKLTIDELEGVVVNVVAYDVKYDKSRELYYADITVKFFTAYFPFIRLAVAAYQQHSVGNNSVGNKGGKDCCLSKIVQADYIQIPPPRATSVEIVQHIFPLKSLSVKVGITGTMPFLSDATYYFPRLEFIMEPVADNPPNSENVVLTIDNKTIGNPHLYELTDADMIKGTDGKPAFLFAHQFSFDWVDAKYKTERFRVKIFEYEFNRATFKERLVFADVHEMNKTGIDG